VTPVPSAPVPDPKITITPVKQTMSTGGNKGGPKRNVKGKNSQAPASNATASPKGGKKSSAPVKSTPSPMQVPHLAIDKNYHHLIADMM
jgi:hypothetical protein